MDEFIMDLLCYINNALCKSGDYLYNIDIENENFDATEYYRNEGINSCCIDLMDFVIKRVELLKQNNNTTKNEKSQYNT